MLVSDGIKSFRVLALFRVINFDFLFFFLLIIFVFKKRTINLSRNLESDLYLGISKYFKSLIIKDRVKSQGWYEKKINDFIKSDNFFFLSGLPLNSCG